MFTPVGSSLLSPFEPALRSAAYADCGPGAESKGASSKEGENSEVASSSPGLASRISSPAFDPRYSRRRQPPSASSTSPASPSADRFIRSPSASDRLHPQFRDYIHQLESTPHREALALAIFGEPLSQLKRRRAVPITSPSHESKAIDGVEIPDFIARLEKQFPEKGARPFLIPKRFCKVLDAPKLVDDFYLNLLSWSDQNVLAVGLESEVYLWDGNTRTVMNIYNTGDPHILITSVVWHQGGTHLSIGQSNGAIQLFDVSHAKSVRTWRHHSTRVGVLAQHANSLLAGSMDGMLSRNDLRQGESKGDRHRYGHEEVVCGLSFAPDGSAVASGGNDNMLKIWDTKTFKVVAQDKFGAAVKGISYHPTDASLLAACGGTADRTFRLYDTRKRQPNSKNLKELARLDMKQQCSSLVWYGRDRCAVGTGYSTDDIRFLQVRKDSIEQKGSLPGHQGRVLSLALSPQGVLASLHSKEALMMCEVGSNPPPSESAETSLLSPLMPVIR